MSAIRKLNRSKLKNEVVSHRHLEFVDGKPYIKVKGDEVKKADISRKTVDIKRGSIGLSNEWRKRKRASEFNAINWLRKITGKKEFRFDKKVIPTKRRKRG